MMARRTSTATLLLVILTLAPLDATLAVAGQPKMYRWVDEQGMVHYGDRIPPEYSRQGSTELSEQGIPVKVNPPAKTAAQLAEEARQAKIREEERRRAEDAAAHDRMLLSTFNTEDDLITVRDGKIASLESAIKIAKGRIESLKGTLQDLKHRAADMERKGEPVSEKLENDIQSTRDQIGNNLSYIQSKQREQEALRNQFEADLVRFRELKAAQAESQKIN